MGFWFLSKNWSNIPKNNIFFEVKIQIQGKLRDFKHIFESNFFFI